MAALLLGAAAGLPTPALATTAIGWTPVGGAGNPCEEQANGCFGAVARLFEISALEITNSQYAELLNSVAASDPGGLYYASMASSGYGGITRSGASGSYVYTVKSGFADRPVTFVSWYSCLRFANWLENGQPVGAQDATTTEDGAYTFSGPTTVGPRHPGARVFLPDEDEWYKAAYYDPVLESYFAYPAGESATTKCAKPGGDNGNAANCNYAVNDSAEVGSYPLSESPNGSYDQGGNAAEWTQTASGSNRVLRGGSWASTASFLSAAQRSLTAPSSHWADVGFRVARAVPEPAPGALAAVSALALLGLRGRAYRGRRGRAGGGRR